MIKKINKAIAISDVHLGEKGCLFNDRHILKDFRNSIAEEGKKGKIDELIILGDLFDLSLASYRDVYEKAEEFFQEIGDIDNLEQIVFIPGNHDHHIWTLIIEEKQITSKLREGKIPEKELKRVDLTYGEESDTFLSGLIKNCKVKKLIVTYPNHLREIGEEMYFFHHGHLLDRIFTPANIVVKANSLQELEAFNSSWTEGIFYHLVQSERLGERIKDGYYELTAMKKLTENFLEKFNIENNTVISRMRGYKIDKLAREIANYLESCIEWYREGKVKIFTPLSFIFGHSHRKSDGEPLDVKNQKIYAYNTGAWHGDKNLAAYLLINGHDRPLLINPV